jgi:hypothetical protein
MRRSGEGMKVRKIYVVNDGAEDVDMAVVGGLLTALGYGLVKYRCYRYDQDWERCEGNECDYIEMLMDRICVDEMEFEANCEVIAYGDETNVEIWCELDDVIDDLNYIITTGKANMRDMLFIAEVDDGYVELDYNSIVGKVLEDFVEEWGEEEDELEGVSEVEVI